MSINTEQQREEPVALFSVKCSPAFDLDGRPHLKLVLVSQTDVSADQSLMDQTAMDQTIPDQAVATTAPVLVGG